MKRPNHLREPLPTGRASSKRARSDSVPSVLVVSDEAKPKTTTTEEKLLSFFSPRIPSANVLNVLRLLSDENTIPFIARYRKEQTGSLTEVEIKAIADAREREDAKEKTRGRILRAIDDLSLIHI